MISNMKHLLSITTTLILLYLPLYGQESLIHEIRLGKQVWSAKNLSVETFRNGDPIAEAKTAEEWQRAAQLKLPVWCSYNNNSAMDKVYGKLYNWYAVSDPRGLAPEGWEIPSGPQWEELIEYLGGKAKASYALKSRKGWENGANGTNISDFNALPAGGRYFDGAFEGLGQYANWWTSTGFDDLHALDRNLNDGNTYSNTYFSSKEDGFSVRCIRSGGSSESIESAIVRRQTSESQKGNGSPQP